MIENAFYIATIDTWLEDFVSEFRHDVRDKIRIGVGEKGHGCHERSAVVIYNILKIERVDFSCCCFITSKKKHSHNFTIYYYHHFAIHVFNYKDKKKRDILNETI